MNGLTIIVLLWCAGNTVASIVGIIMLVATRRFVDERMRSVDISEQLRNVMDRLDRQAIHKDRELREAVELLIKRLEADPLTRDRHFIDITALKEKLR